MQTNRDLYLAVAALIEQQKSNCRSLEEYLRALGELAQRYRPQSALSLNDFFQLLSNAFTADVPPFEEAWKTCYTENSEASGFENWQATLRQQIVDLHEMEDRGTLKGIDHWFGVSSPRGQRWYNCFPCGFLECATEGTYGGWEPGDNTGRAFVPGPVAVLGDDGKIETRDPRELQRPTISILEVTWQDFRYFLRQGQWYE